MGNSGESLSTNFEAMKGFPRTYRLTACNYSYIQLIDFNARFYSPRLGRFIQPDSIIPNWTNPQSLNRFSYVLNSPLMFVDPSGHMYAGPCIDGENCFNLEGETSYSNSQSCNGIKCDIPELAEDKDGKNNKNQPESVNNSSGNEITGFTLFGSFEGKLISLLPIPFFSSVRGSIPFGIACIMKGVNAGDCTLFISESQGAGLNLPGVAEGTYDQGISLLLNTYSIDALEGVDFEVGVEFDIQVLGEVGGDISYSWALGQGGKNGDGTRIGALNIALGGGASAEVPGIGGSIYSDVSTTKTFGKMTFIDFLYIMTAPIQRYINP